MHIISPFHFLTDSTHYLIITPQYVTGSVLLAGTAKCCHGYVTSALLDVHVLVATLELHNDCKLLKPARHSALGWLHQEQESH